MIETVTDYNIEAFLGSDLCALILARSTCNRSITYQDDVRRLIDSGALGAIRVGVLLLDQRGVSQFKRQNLWLMGTEHLPYTMLYRRGLRVDGFPAARGHTLLDRARRSPILEPLLVKTD